MNNLDMNITNKQLPVVAFNFTELKVTLDEKLAYYKSLVVTEDNLAICKADQRELAGLRNKVDEKRLEIKKEIEKPIKAFEDECKQLIALIVDAEKSIKDQTTIFDDKKRAEKRKDAEKIIADMIEKHGLKDEFAAQLTVLEPYCQLSATYKGVYEAIEQRTLIYLSQQQAHESMLEMLQSTIDNANQGINTKLSLAEFDYLIKSKMPAKDIITEINKRAEKIKIAEQPKEEEVATPVVIAPSAPVKQEVKPTDTKYFVELRVQDSKFNIEVLGKLLRDNNFEYIVLNKGPVKC